VLVGAQHGLLAHVDAILLRVHLEGVMKEQGVRPRQPAGEGGVMRAAGIGVIERGVTWDHNLLM
jgi:hypothetical protein